LLTPVSVDRPWVLVEVGAAWAWQMRIVPVLDHVMADRIPGIITGKKAFLINDFERYLTELKTRVEE
jgi:hypothetical protein